MSGYLEIVVTSSAGMMLNSVQKFGRIKEAEEAATQFSGSFLTAPIRCGGVFANRRSTVIHLDNYRIGVYVGTRKPMYDSFYVSVKGDVILM